MPRRMGRRLRRGRRVHPRREGAWRAHRRDRHDEPPPPRKRRGGDRRGPPFAGETRLFILPGYRFKAVDLLLTNFHLPRSTLFHAGGGVAELDRMQAAYAHAVESGLPVFLLWRRLPDRALARKAPSPPPGAKKGWGEVVDSHYVRACPSHPPAPRAPPSPPNGRKRGMTIGFEVLARDGAARAGRLSTAHGNRRDAGLHAGPHRGDGQGDDPGRRRRDRARG